MGGRRKCIGKEERGIEERRVSQRFVLCALCLSEYVKWKCNTERKQLNYTDFTN